MSVRPSMVATSGEALCDLIAGHPDGVVVVDGEGIVLFANPAAEHLLAPPGSTVVGMAFGAVAIATSGDRTEIMSPATGVVAGIRTSEIQWDGRDALLIALREAAVPTPTSPAVPEPGMILSPEAEELTGMGSFEIELATRAMKRSAGYRRISGRDEEFFAEHPAMVTEVIFPDDVRRLEEELAAVAAGGPVHSTELRLARPDGEIRIARLVAQAVEGPGGRPVKVRGVLRDITEERRALEALRSSEERFRLLAEHSQDAIFLIRMKPRPTVEYVSPAAERVIGHPLEELMGDLETVMRRLLPQNRHLAMDSLNSPTTEPMIYPAPQHDGSVRWFEQRLFSIKDDAGELVAIEGVLRNVTEKVQAEQKQRRLDLELQQAERLEVLGRLAGGVAHDFNNLLAVVMGTAAMLVEDTGADDPRRADVERILYAAERGAALTRQLLIFSRREPSQPEVLDLNEVIGKIEDLLRRTIGEDIELTYELSPALPAVSIDRGKLEQVILNLVVNARAAMPGGGRLVIETSLMVIEEPRAEAGAAAAPPPPPVLPTPVPAGRYVRLAVADTGTGMAPEIARRAFEPFFTTRESGEGTGIGLATVQGVVQEAGGHVTLDTALGSGTTIGICLPVTAERAASGEPDVSVGPDVLRGDGRTVLVVEDEEAVREVVAGILSRNGYRVVPVHNGTRALEICAETDRRIDLVLTDLIMPGISGRSLAELLRATVRPDVPVLFMSGYAAEGRRSGAGPGHTGTGQTGTGQTGTGQTGTERAHHGDETSVLYKPFDAITLLRRVHHALHRAGPG